MPGLSSRWWWLSQLLVAAWWAGLPRVLRLTVGMVQRQCFAVLRGRRLLPRALLPASRRGNVTPGLCPCEWRGVAAVPSMRWGWRSSPADGAAHGTLAAARVGSAPARHFQLSA